VLEKELERWSMKYARQHGGWLLKFTSPGTAGVPDRILLMPGCAPVFVEFTAAGGRVTPLQRAVMAKIEDHGGKCFVINSKEAFTELLEAISAGGSDPLV